MVRCLSHDFITLLAQADWLQRALGSDKAFAALVGCEIDRDRSHARKAADIDDGSQPVARMPNLHSDCKSKRNGNALIGTGFKSGGGR